MDTSLSSTHTPHLATNNRSSQYCLCSDATHRKNAFQMVSYAPRSHRPLSPCTLPSSKNYYKVATRQRSFASQSTLESPNTTMQPQNHLPADQQLDTQRCGHVLGPRSQRVHTPLLALQYYSYNFLNCCKNLGRSQNQYLLTSHGRQRYTMQSQSQKIHKTISNQRKLLPWCTHYCNPTTMPAVSRNSQTLPSHCTCYQYLSTKLRNQLTGYTAGK